MYTHAHTLAHTCMHTHRHTHTHAHMHTHSHTHARIHTDTHTHAHTHAHTLAHTCTHTHRHTHACTHTCTHTRTHMHTHTLTHTHTYVCPHSGTPPSLSLEALSRAELYSNHPMGPLNISPLSPSNVLTICSQGNLKPLVQYWVCTRSKHICIAGQMRAKPRTKFRVNQPAMYTDNGTTIVCFGRSHKSCLVIKANVRRVCTVCLVDDRLCINQYTSRQKLGVSSSTRAYFFVSFTDTLRIRFSLVWITMAFNLG